MKDSDLPEINTDSISLETGDESLMRDVASGSQDAFEMIFDRYSVRIINFAYRFLASREEAEDIAQEVFLRIYKAREKYNPARPFKPWLFSITSRLISNQRRMKKRHPQESLDWTFENLEGNLQETILSENKTHLPDEVIQKQQLISTVQEALRKLPEDQRKAVIFARYEEMSYEEIADTIGVSVSAVKSLLFRARASLKVSLGSQIEKIG